MLSLVAQSSSELTYGAFKTALKLAIEFITCQPPFEPGRLINIGLAFLQVPAAYPRGRLLDLLRGVNTVLSWLNRHMREYQIKTAYTGTAIDCNGQGIFGQADVTFRVQIKTPCEDETGAKRELAVLPITSVKVRHTMRWAPLTAPALPTYDDVMGR